MTKREVLERAQADLAASKVFAEEARFDVARRLSEVSGLMPACPLPLESRHGKVNNFQQYSSSGSGSRGGRDQQQQ